MPPESTSQQYDKIPISVVILTLNEEETIHGCLESVAPYFSEIIILDSNSSDRTAEIARSFGARVTIREFDNYANQRSHALKNLDKKNNWVLFLDADERLASACVEELVALSSRPDFDEKSLYRIRRKDYFHGRWLRRSSGYPIWLGRLCKSDDSYIKREVNEEYCTRGEVGYLQSHLAHFPFSKGIEHWVARHNRYSTMEANHLVRTDSSITWKSFLDKDPSKRRRECKILFYKLPAKPILSFLYFYFLRLGFIDGYPGFSYCVFRSFYEFIIAQKLTETNFSPSPQSQIRLSREEHIRPNATVDSDC